MADTICAWKIIEFSVFTVERILVLTYWEQGLLYEHGLTLIPAWISKHPDSKVHGAYMGPTWGRQDPGGPHISPMNFIIRAHAQ